jgi:GDP-4-dehydro-6-deoxy-D-mannose reductase
MRALITGITGFVGSHMAELLLSKGVEVYGTKRWRSPMDNIKHIKDKITLEEFELRDFISVNRVIKKVEPDLIYHLAAQSYVPASFVNPLDTLNVNIIGTANLLEAVRQSGMDPKVHICSSSEVYGGVKKDEVPIKESNSLRPLSPYGVSKVGEDMLGQQYFASYGVKTFITRMFTHTGQRRGELFVVSAFAKQIAEIEKGIKQDPIVKVGNLDSVRTFADVRDAVKAYWLLTEKCRPGEVYNIGGEATMKIGEMLDKLIELSDRKDIKPEVDKELFRPSDVTLQIPDTTKFREETGWKPEIPFEQTLKDTLDYWRNNV